MVVPRLRAAAASGASFRIGDSWIDTARWEIFISPPEPGRPGRSASVPAHPQKDKRQFLNSESHPGCETPADGLFSMKDDNPFQSGSRCACRKMARRAAGVSVATVAVGP
jgi:hypothetical protein